MWILKAIEKQTTANNSTLQSAVVCSQCCGSGFIESGSGSGFIESGSGSSISSESTRSGSRVLMSENWKKYSWQNLYLLWSKSLGPLKVRPSYRKSLQSSKRTSSTSKNEIYYLFLFLRVIFALMDTGSGLRIRIRIQGPHWIWIQSESGSTTLVEVKGAINFCYSSSEPSTRLRTRSWPGTARESPRSSSTSSGPPSTTSTRAGVRVQSVKIA